LGGRVRPGRMEILLALPRCLIVPVLAWALASDWGETVIARHANKARMEMRSISADLVALADLAGSEAPTLRQLARFA